jgi:hypothetical protein
LTAYGAPAGTAVWFEQDRVFAYTLPGLMPGAVAIGPEELKANYGGWPFTPDSTWLNLQIIASRHFKEFSRQKGSAGQVVRTEPAEPTRRVLSTDTVRE